MINNRDRRGPLSLLCFIFPAEFRFDFSARGERKSSGFVPSFSQSKPSLLFRRHFSPGHNFRLACLFTFSIRIYFISFIIINYFFPFSFRVCFRESLMFARECSLDCCLLLRKSAL